MIPPFNAAPFDSDTGEPACPEPRDGVKRRAVSALKVALSDLLEGAPAAAEARLRPLVRAYPHWPEPWLALRGARWAMGRRADAEATRDEWHDAAPAQAAIIDVAMARPLSVRGLPFDDRDLLPVRDKAAALRTVTHPAGLQAGVDACFTIHPAGTPVRYDPVIPVADDGSDRIPVVTETEESFVAVFHDAALAGRGLVVTQHNEVVRETLLETHVRKHGVKLGSRHVRVLPGRHTLDGSVPVRIHDRPALLMTGPTDRSFGDWIWRFPPRLALAAAAGLDLPLVVSRKVPPRFLELLELLGVDRSRLIVHDPRGLSLFRALYVTSWPTADRLRPMHAWNGVYEDLARRGMAWCREASAPAVPERPRLYLARTGVDDRRLVNEPDVMARFERRGFRVLQPEQLPWRDVLTSFACPAVVAGPYGSALRNLAFTHQKPIGLVLMPPCDDAFLRGSALWLAEMGIRFACVHGRALPRPDDDPLRAAPWRVDLDEVDRAIDRVLVAAG